MKKDSLQQKDERYNRNYLYRDYDITSLLNDYATKNKGIYVMPPLSIGSVDLKDSGAMAKHQVKSAYDKITTINENSSQEQVVDIVDDIKNYWTLLNKDTQEKVVNKLLEYPDAFINAPTKVKIREIYHSETFRKNTDPEKKIAELVKIAGITASLSKQEKESLRESLNKQTPDDIYKVLAQARQREIVSSLEARNKDLTEQEFKTLADQLIRNETKQVQANMLTTANEVVMQRLQYEIKKNPNGKFIVPINHNGNHWTTVVLAKKDHKITAIHNDSMSRKNDQQNPQEVDGAILGYEMNDGIRKLLHKNFNNLETLDLMIGQQQNQVDCGTFAVGNSKTICDKFDEIVANQNNRQKLGPVMLSGKDANATRTEHMKCITQNSNFKFIDDEANLAANEALITSVLNEASKERKSLMETTIALGSQVAESFFEAIKDIFAKDGTLKQQNNLTSRLPGNFEDLADVNKKKHVILQTAVIKESLEKNISLPAQGQQDQKFRDECIAFTVALIEQHTDSQGKINPEKARNLDEFLSKKASISTLNKFAIGLESADNIPEIKAFIEQTGKDKIVLAGEYKKLANDKSNIPSVQK